MPSKANYPARDALRVVDGPLAVELGIHRFDAPSRSKAQLFALGGPQGRQFAILVGNTDVKAGIHPAQQTRLLFERCELPSLSGIEPCLEPYQGSRIKDQRDSKLAAPNQVSCLVADEAALRGILRWYSKLPSSSEAGFILERTRVEKAARDAGFDLGPSQRDEWVVFRSTAFLVEASVEVLARDRYRFEVSDPKVAQRLRVEFGLASAPGAGALATVCDAVEGYERLHQLLLRAAALSRVVAQEGLREYSAVVRNPPASTEAVREVVQRVGQDIFRRSLIEYWGGRCAVTGLDVIELLRASHIKPWADCQDDVERLDVFNGLLLAPQLDALFDRGFLSFSDDGHMLRSPLLSERQWALLGVEMAAVRPVVLAREHLAYLRWHRAKVFRAGVGVEEGRHDTAALSKPV